MNKYNTKIISLCGPPGAGKSTLSALLFSRLKIMGQDVELVPEFAKKLTWHNRHNSLDCQVYVHGKQVHEVYQLMGKVSLIVTDSPSILSAYYAEDKWPNSFTSFVVDYYKTLPTINYFLRRVKKYNPNGRNQTEKESDEIGSKLEKLLISHNIPYKAINGCEFEIQTIIDDLKEKGLIHA